MFSSLFSVIDFPFSGSSIRLYLGSYLVSSVQFAVVNFFLYYIIFQSVLSCIKHAVCTIAVKHNWNVGWGNCKILEKLRVDGNIRGQEGVSVCGGVSQWQQWELHPNQVFPNFNNIPDPWNKIITPVSSYTMYKKGKFCYCSEKIDMSLNGRL